MLKRRPPDPKLVERNKRLRAERMLRARAIASHSAEEWADLKARFAIDGKFLCVVCGDRRWHVDKDHIVPVYLGGSDGIDNLQPVCARCNAAKWPDSTHHAALRLTAEALL